MGPWQRERVGLGYLEEAGMGKGPGDSWAPGSGGNAKEQDCAADDSSVAQK